MRAFQNRQSKFVLRNIYSKQFWSPKILVLDSKTVCCISYWLRCRSIYLGITTDKEQQKA